MSTFIPITLHILYLLALFWTSTNNTKTCYIHFRSKPGNFFSKFKMQTKTRPDLCLHNKEFWAQYLAQNLTLKFWFTIRNALFIAKYIINIKKRWENKPDQNWDHAPLTHQNCLFFLKHNWELDLNQIFISKAVDAGWKAIFIVDRCNALIRLN